MSGKRPLAQVVRVRKIEEHPDGHSLDVLTIEEPGVIERDVHRFVRLVTGKHYEAGQFGIWIRPGCRIPGWLALDLWLCGKDRALEWFEVRKISIRGVESEGLFVGQRWRNSPADNWQDWGPWQRSWSVATDVTAYLGVKR